LTPQGLFLQWVQGYQMSPRDLGTILRTVRQEFGHLNLWRGAQGDFLILAGMTPPHFSLSGFQAEFDRNPQLRADSSDYLGIHEPAGLLGYYLLDDSELLGWIARGDLNTDDRNLLEYRAGSSITKSTVQLNFGVVQGLRRNPLPSFMDIGDRSAAVQAAIQTQLDAGLMNSTTGFPLVPELLKLPEDNARTLLLRASVELQQDRPAAALAELQRAQQLDGRDATVACKLASVQLAFGEQPSARAALENCLALSPQNAPAIRAMVEMEQQAGRLESAIAFQQRLLATGPRRPYVEWAQMGNLYLSAGQMQPAAEAFKRSLEIEPLGYLAHRSIAELLIRNGQLAKAIGEYRFLIQYHPNEDPLLYLTLSGLYQKTGQTAAVRETMQNAKRIFPNSPEVEQAVWQTGSY
jgi:tetratricopeptide (TPR) repeat protein